MKRGILLEYRAYNTGKLRTVSGSRPFSCHQFRFELERKLSIPIDRVSQSKLIDLDYSVYSDIFLLEHPSSIHNLSGINTREIGLVRDSLVNLCNNYHNKDLHVLYPLKNLDLDIVLNSNQRRREKSNNWWPNIRPIVEKAYKNQILSLENPNKDENILYSDSHGHMVWTPEYDKHYYIYGKTLHGFLNNSDTDFFKENRKKSSFFFGTVDLHHHLGRFKSEKTVELAKEYALALNWLQKTGHSEQIDVYLPLKPYPENRGVKRAYWYKGKSVHGTFEYRYSLWNIFCDTMKTFINKTINLYYPNIDTKNVKIYEPQKGIHLRHQYYLWDFNENKINNSIIWKEI